MSRTTVLKPSEVISVLGPLGFVEVCRCEPHTRSISKYALYQQHAVFLRAGFPDLNGWSDYDAGAERGRHVGRLANRDQMIGGITLTSRMREKALVSQDGGGVSHTDFGRYGQPLRKLSLIPAAVYEEGLAAVAIPKWRV